MRLNVFLKIEKGPLSIFMVKAFWDASQKTFIMKILRGLFSIFENHLSTLEKIFYKFVAKLRETRTRQNAYFASF